MGILAKFLSRPLRADVENCIRGAGMVVVLRLVRGYTPQYGEQKAVALASAVTNELFGAPPGNEAGRQYAGFGARELRSKTLGHNLGALLEAASREGTLRKPTLDTFDRKAISWGGKDYSKKCFEYPEFMVSTHPTGKWLLIARKLITSAQNLVTPPAVITAAISNFVASTRT